MKPSDMKPTWVKEESPSRTRNLSRPPIHIAHASLPKWDAESSAYKVLCPVCKGILLVHRDAETFRIVREDICVNCWQRYHYIDVAIAGDPLPDDATPTTPYLRPTATEGAFEVVWPDISGNGNDMVGPAPKPAVSAIRVTQHIPDFVDPRCARPDPVYVRTLGELCLVPFVKSWREKDFGPDWGAFIRYSTDGGKGARIHLMAEFQRAFWVVAYLDGDEDAIQSLGLPKWRES